MCVCVYVRVCVSDTHSRYIRYREGVGVIFHHTAQRRARSLAPNGVRGLVEEYIPYWSNIPSSSHIPF